MIKYNVYERIILSGYEPLNTWQASFLCKADAESYAESQNHINSIRKPQISKYYYIHSECTN